VTPATAFDFNIDAGESSDVVAFWVYNDAGNLLGASTLVGASLTLVAVVGGVEVADGLPVLDQQMGRIQIIDQDDAADSTMPHQVTGTMSIGANAAARLYDIPPGCGRKFNFQIVASASPGSGPSTLRLKVIYDANSQPASSRLSLASGAGVVPGYRNAALRRIVRGRNIVADGTDVLVVERGAVDFDGVRTFVVRTTLGAIDQNDGAIAALAAGQSYIALISQAADGSVTVTKGTKATVPVAPPLPAGQIRLGTVVVAFNGGGTAIAQGDVTLAAIGGDYEVIASGGRTVVVSPGEGLSSTDLYDFSSSPVSLTLADNSASWIWMQPNGLPTSTTTAGAPVVGAYLLATATTDAGAVVALADARTLLDAPVRERVLTMRIADAFSQLTVPVLAIVTDILPEAAELELVTLDISDVDGTWTAGALQIDVRSIAPGTSFAAAGATIYTGFAVDDRRPAFAYNAGGLRVESRDHEVRRFPAGTRFALDIIAVPTAPAPEPSQELFVQLHFRMR
jgi:hypothetical protein